MNNFIYQKITFEFGIYYIKRQTKIKHIKIYILARDKANSIPIPRELLLMKIKIETKLIESV